MLEIIQDEFGTINEFERKLLGLRFLKDKEGKQILGKDGEPVMYAGEVSIKAIKVALPAMINEGLQIEADETGKTFDPIEDEYILRNCNISFELLGEIIQEEFKKCFEIKKKNLSGQGITKRKK